MSQLPTCLRRQKARPLRPVEKRSEVAGSGFGAGRFVDTIPAVPHLVLPGCPPTALFDELKPDGRLGSEFEVSHIHWLVPPGVIVVPNVLVK